MCIFTLDCSICKLSSVSRDFGCASLSLYMHWTYINLLILQVPCSSHVRQNKRGMHLERTQTHTYSKLRYYLFTNERNVHESLLIWNLVPFYLYEAFHLQLSEVSVSSELVGKEWTESLWIWLITYMHRYSWCVKIWLGVLHLHSELVHGISLYDARR